MHLSRWSDSQFSSLVRAMRVLSENRKNSSSQHITLHFQIRAGTSNEIIKKKSLSMEMELTVPVGNLYSQGCSRHRSRIISGQRSISNDSVYESSKIEVELSSLQVNVDNHMIVSIYGWVTVKHDSNEQWYGDAERSHEYSSRVLLQDLWSISQGLILEKSICLDLNQ